MRYFSIITQDHWTPKNKLHADVLKAAYQRNRIILNDLNAVRKFCDDFNDAIGLLNVQYQRCKPMSLHIGQSQVSEPDEKFHLMVSGVFWMSIHREQV